MRVEPKVIDLQIIEPRPQKSWIVMMQAGSQLLWCMCGCVDLPQEQLVARAKLLDEAADPRCILAVPNGFGEGTINVRRKFRSQTSDSMDR